ncbi:MAG: gliding motility-associated transport system ATP-binding protein [Clostridiales bacterium]|jgi:ABC-2 type transport system ATP-binding protein|nr:ABC-type multidrug transport system, ATPase component [Oscillospiraceae bacterium]MDN5378107.1 gliding motility-associated transport system ATP-binding protein [Clostridiales bacterium]
MIEVKNLSKHYGEKRAVDNISFSVKEGEILGFLGPNGAGKSTTMNILTGYISSTSGNALINGVDILENPAKAKAQIGYLPEIPPLYLDMTVKEYLNFIYDLKKCKLNRENHLKEICGLVKITDVYNRIIKNLSKGYKQRVGLAQALVGNPPVLILDEPTVGLDPKQIIEIRSLIKKLGEKHTVILSSHILSEVQAVCDRIVIINRGKIAADDTAENLSKSITNDHKLIARIDGPRDEVVKLIRTINGVVKVVADMERENGVYDYEIEAVEGTDIRRELFKRLASRNWPLLGLKSTELTLEDIFLKITMGEGIEIKSQKPKEEAAPTEEPAKDEPNSDENKDTNGNDGGAN